MRPPEDIWLDEEALGDHFENVRQRVKSGDTSGGEDWEDIPQQQNELTAGIRKGHR